MRTITIFLLTMLFCLSSCQKEEVYSCDPTVDRWARTNLPEIQQMTRSNWLEVEEELSIAAYRVFTPIQKYNFWIEKINEVLDLGWNSNEETHLKKILEYVINNPRLFDAIKDENLYNDFEIFTYKWIEYAQEELSWDKKLIGAIIADGRRLRNKQGDAIVKRNTHTISVKRNIEDEDKGKDCQCSVDYDWCGGSAHSCQDRGCTESTIDWGCGNFMGHRCTGRCHIIEY